MIEHKGDLYVIGLREITASGCLEDAPLVVELDWPTNFGLAEVAQEHGFELVWPRRPRTQSLQTQDSNAVYQLDRLNPTYRAISDARGELLVFAKRVSRASADSGNVPQRFRKDFPLAPEFLADALISIEERELFSMQPRDLQSSEQVESLNRNLFDRPEALFQVTAPTDTALPTALRAALEASDVLISKTDLHYYRAPDPLDDNDFVQVLPGVADAEWQVRARQSKRFSRHTLVLSEKKRRAFEVMLHLQEQSKQSANPLKLEPNFMGIGVDLRKLWKLASVWFRKKS